MLRLPSMLVALWLMSPAFSRVVLPAGRFAPLVGLETGQLDLPIGSFSLDVRPVTRAQFEAFLKEHPQWRRGQASKQLTDERYLSSLERLTPTSPVVEVSYFAARAYCDWAQGRLPTTLEWEYAAAADETERDASRGPHLTERILEWYSKPFSFEDLKATGTPRNVYGVKALHGLVWEWTVDFNAQLAASDSRQEGNADTNFTCGGGTLGSNRREEYAAFIRYALRSSLSPRDALPNLGFRRAGASP